MSIVVGEKQGARVSSINNLHQATYTRVWVAETDNPAIGAPEVREASGLPAIGAYYSDGRWTDRGSFVVSKEARETSDDGKAWEVTVQYGPYDASLFPRDPTAWPLKATWGAQRYTRPATKALDADDAYTVPIVNSAGDPFSEPVEIDDHRVILTVVRNERVKAVAADPLATPPTPAIPAFDLDLIRQYRDKINDAEWNGAAAYTVKCNSITPGEPQLSPDGVWFVPVTYVFEERDDEVGWTKVLLDQGYAELDSSSPPVAKQIKGKDGQPIHEPVPLNGSGAKLVHGNDEVYLDFDVYLPADFSVFNIDLTQRLGAT